MSDFGGYDAGNGHSFCPQCGGYDGVHDYEQHGIDSSGGSSTGSGGRLIAQIIFIFFEIIGVCMGAIFPPLGALIIYIGAYITGV